MENDQLPKFSVGDFIASTNQILEYAYPSLLVEGEIEAFKVSQGKFVFFNLKDGTASVGCFMMAFALRIPLEDGMKVMVRARPKLTQFGKFSLTVDAIKPIGEGSIKKGFELLKQTLDKEGLFAVERKRSLPTMPRVVGVISSMQSAGYADFMKIAEERWGGVEFRAYHVTVQGMDAPDEMIRAIRYFNELKQPVDALVLVRGGGSADDLAAFNDEALVRAIASSRTPTLVGVGHEVDVTLSDLVADVRAATPSNAAQLLLPDRQEMLRHVVRISDGLAPRVKRLLVLRHEYVAANMATVRRLLSQSVEARLDKTLQLARLLQSYDPKRILEQGYSLVRGEHRVGGVITVESQNYTLTAEVQTYEQK